MSVDNYFFFSVGFEWIGWIVLYCNLIGWGDLFVVFYNIIRLFDDELDVFDFIYNLFINVMNGIL